MKSLQGACFVLAACATVCTFVALRTIGDGQKHVLPLVNGSRANQSVRQVKTSKLKFFHRRPGSVDGQADFRERVLHEQAKRQQRLAQGCRAIWERSGGRARSKPLVRLSLLVNVPSPFQITYCAIPKCGTSTWLQFFESVTGRTCKSVEVHYCARLRFSKPLSREDFLPRSLVIVRDPWRRLVSAYADKFVTERHPLAASCYRRSGKSLYSGVPVTFAEFVQCILADYRSGRQLDAHYAPQHWQCSLCRVNYSYIAKMENIAEDFQYLATHVFPKRNYEVHRKIFWSGRRRPKELRNTSTILYEDCYRSLKPADMSKLVSLYRPDAELFGYQLQPLPRRQ